MADAVLSRKLPVDAHATTPVQRHPWWIAGGSGVLALCLYAIIGRWDGQALQAHSWPATAQALAAQQDLPLADGARHPGGTQTIEDRIAKLEQRLREAPNDLEGWVLLSRSRGIQRDFSGATAALEKALALAPGHPDILADLADVMAMTNNKLLAGRPLDLINEALRNAPEHRKALSLAATAAMQSNDRALAVQYWKRLRATFPAGAPDIAQVDSILASITSAVPPAASSASPGAEASAIDGTVELSPELIAALKKQALPTNATLFVLAKSPSGPPMPLAVVRFPAHQLAEGKSITFRLDDSQAISADLTLSSRALVNLEARVSMSGTALKQSGDLFAALPNVKVGTHKLRLLIQSPLP